MNPRFRFAPWVLLLALCIMASPSHLQAQTRPPVVRVAYSALSAGIGTLWITHETTPQLKQADLRKLVDERFVRGN